MQILLGKIQGFCNGVNYTIEKVTKLLEENDKMYCLGELVHNEGVISKLKGNGLVIINDIEEAKNNSTVIFRAHGEAKEIYEKANEKNIKIIDLTCGRVKAIHKKVAREKDNSFIIVIGKPNHPEIIGTISYAEGNGVIINSEEDLDKIKTDMNRIYICCQTTYSLPKFNELLQKIKDKFKDKEIIVDNTICEATTSRQEEVNELSTKVDVLIVIGGKNSSNTKELFNIAKKNCNEVYIIQDASDLQELTLDSNDVIGIVSGASTPKDIVEEVKRKLS